MLTAVVMRSAVRRTVVALTLALPASGLEQQQDGQWASCGPSVTVAEA